MFRLPWPFRPRPPEVAVIRLKGVIGDAGAFRQGLHAEALEAILKAAFTPRRTVAVALVINSPGGSPVQSDLIRLRIEALAREHGKPVTAFTSDVCASGGYWIAQAADDIIAHPASIVGSIGVISAGFGMQEALARLGIERRVHAQGSAKGMLDPFRPEKPEEVARLNGLQQELHENFKDLVRRRRGGRLKGEEGELFSGAFWSGSRARELGLVDGLGDLHTVMRERYGARVRFRNCGGRRPVWQRLRRPAGGLSAGSSFAHDLLAGLEERLFWNRFGL